MSSSKHVITHAIKAHTSDIKAVCSAVINDHDVIFTVGRDGKGVAHVHYPGSSTWQRKVVFDAGQRFANSVCFVPSSAEYPDSLLIGSLDGLIRSYNLPDNFTTSHYPVTTLEPTHTIQEHHDNITSLVYSSSHDTLLSGSWDTTARSYKRDIKGKWHVKHLLKGHESAVWGVAIASADSYLTASADLFIRLFEGQECKVVWSGHQDVVRCIKLLPPAASEGEEQLFVSTSNDPNLLINSLDPRARPPGIPTNGGEPVRVLKGHTSIVYDLAVCQDKFVTASEDGTARIWNWREQKQDQQLQETIWHPKNIGSVWCVASLHGGDIVTGGSDGVLRVFSTLHKDGHGERIAEEQGKQDKEMSLGEQDNTFGPLTVDQIESFNKDANEAEQSTRRAEYLVTSTPSSSSTNRQQHPTTGILYDALLPIDVSDDTEALLLGVNKGDDPRQVAQRFIEEHDLPRSYLEEIVAFVTMLMPK
ncbi:unnamed protein product [Sympodiomycopsis kandeliae]